MLDLELIKRDFAHALRPSCSEKGCTLSLQGLGDRVVLKGEEISQARQAHKPPMCDCIIFVVDSSIIIGIVELKSKTVDVSQVEKKLVNSSRIALNIVEKYTDNRAEIEFYHLVLCKRWRHAEHREIKGKRIRVRGKKKGYSIITKRCGISFSEAISEFKK